MPTYSYYNTKTKEEIDIVMSMSEVDAYEAKNTHMQRVYNKVNIVDPAGIGVSKPPADFQKYVLGKVQSANPHTNIGNRRWSIPKEV